MSDEELRIKCWELAKQPNMYVQINHEAKVIYDFVKGKSDTEIDAALKVIQNKVN
jgi:hypothetical protein